MADDIRAEEPGMAIETISYYDTDEPSGDERSFFEVVEKLRGRAGHRISVTEFERQTSKEALAPLPDEYFAATPGYFAKSLHWAARIETIQQKTGTRVILSGLGGDEILGGVQYEAPELADHLRAGRIASFFQSTLRWALARRKTVYRLLGDTFTLLCASYQPGSLLTDSIQSLPWAHLKPIADHRNLRTFAHWQGLSPVLLFMESIRYGLAQQLTCTDPPLVGCVERRYPYLDRSLFVFLASIPRTQVLQAGRRRHLMRRALRGIVPDRVLFRKTKWFGLRSSVASLNEVQEILDSQLKGDWLSDTMVVDVAALREHLPALQHGSSGDPKALHAAVAIELWLRLVHRRGMVDLAPAQAKSCPARPHLESCS
jgi:asparagine synthase (glutamine-hydrolysing)